MKFVLLLSVSIILAGSHPLWASGDTPPIPVEVTDKSSEGAETFAFQIREKLRASQSFKLVTSNAQARIHLAMLIEKDPVNSDVLIISAVWTYEQAGAALGTLVNQTLVAIGPKRQEEQVNELLATTEQTYQLVITNLGKLPK